MSKQRYVIFRGEVFRWEEKAPFIKSGKSILNGLEYDRDADKVKCHECGEWFTHIGDPHMRRHGMTQREYRSAHQISSALCTPTHSNRAALRGKSAAERMRSDPRFKANNRCAKERGAQFAASRAMTAAANRNKRGVCPPRRHSPRSGYGARHTADLARVIRTWALNM